MGTDGSDENGRDREGSRVDPLSDTQELPEVKGPAPAKDPWNEITPARFTEVATALTDDLIPDGPVPVPLDAPPPRRPDPPSALARQSFQNAFTAPIAIPRRTARGGSQVGVAPSSVRPEPYRAGARRPSGIERPIERRYPKMRALLSKPDEVPHGFEPRARSRAAAVPGTFSPAPRREKVLPAVSAAPVDLDDMLATMAEGLLIGEDASGGTEVRVTLRDEFFAGTELRINCGDGQIRAVLIPPDRGTYLTLNGNIDELRARLEARGLRVVELKVAEP